MISGSQVQTIARACHEANRAWCLAHGDMSQPTWIDAPDWQRSSCVQGVHGAIDGNTPEQLHESWLAEKERNGWTYGPVKNPVEKTHPCFVPYADLPPAQKAKDAIFVGVVAAFLNAFAALESASE